MRALWRIRQPDGASLNAATSPRAQGFRPAESAVAVLLRVEVSALRHPGAPAVHGRSPLLRVQSDERLIALVRRGNHHAFEALVARYQSRLLAFCRHMLSSREDAEDVLQEVFAAAFNAILADEREINVRPWLYRIARNRSLNHLRRAQAIGVDSMDVHLSEGGLTTADKVHRREEFRLLMGDVQELPETQRTALLLREIDALSYEQIAEAMETTVPSVKSLLVRARVSLAEAAEARLLTCQDVRIELGEVAEGLRRTSAPVRRHLRTCERCATFRRQLRQTNKALASMLPVAPLLLLKKTLLAHLGTTVAASGSSAAAGAAATSGGAAAGGALGAGVSALATKTVAGLAAAAIVTAGAVEVKHAAVHRAPAVRATQLAAAPAPTVAPAVPVPVSSAPQPVAATPAVPEKAAKPARKRSEPTATPTPTPTPTATPATPASPPAAPNRDQHDGDTTALPTVTTGTTQSSGGTLPTQPVEPPATATPAPTPSSTPAPTPSPTPAPSPTPSPSPTPAPSPSPTAEPSPTPESEALAQSPSVHAGAW